MGTFIARIKVKDYQPWRTAFDANNTGRRRFGLSNERIYRLAEDGNELMLVMDADDMGKAREFASSDIRKDAMAKSGVIGTATDYFVD